MYIAVKRVIDTAICIILLPFIGVVILLAAIAIKIDDGGPVFYTSKRTGLYGKPFDIYKLRSMKVNAPDIRLADGSTYNGEDDPRVTRVGAVLRKTSIDELPQLLNILKGDMAFIGPRPDSASYIDKYTEEERIILTVRPGITGYNQAVNRNSVGTKEKLQNDIYYVNRMSFLFDLKIIFMTIKTVFSSKDVYRSNEESSVITEKLSVGTEEKTQ